MICLIGLISSTSLFGQSGLQLYTGISNAKSKDALLTPEGKSHPGFHLGADARLNSGNMYFVVGGQYHVIEFLAVDDKNFFSIDQKMQWLKLRVGLGYNIYNFNSRLAIRAKTLGSIDVISSHPGSIAMGPYEIFNSGTAGAVIGIGLDAYGFTFDIEYEKGFFNAVNMVKGTEFNFFTISIGVIF